MRSMRCASPISASSDCMARGLFPGDMAERRADRHADAREIAFPKYVAGHDLAGGEDVRRSSAVAKDDLRALVHPRAKIGEGDAGTQWISEEGRRVDAPRPMR